MNVFLLFVQRTTDVLLASAALGSTSSVPTGHAELWPCNRPNGGLLGALGTWAEVLTDLAGLSVA